MTQSVRRPESEAGEDEARFAEAVAIANLPTLLMVLVQLGGERRWLEPPYRPSRGRGMGDHDDGGLPEEIQQEIRAAALDAILAWRSGKPPALPDPPHELLVEMLSVAMGERVPPEYGEFVASQLGQRRMLAAEPIPVPAGFSVLVIGAGVSGLCAAVNLKAAGIPFSVLEKNASVGGTWLVNRYPGAGVDTPNHLYSFSFAEYDWSMYFALRDELHGYLEHVAERFELGPHLRLGTEVESLRWEAEQARWAISVRRPDGSSETLHASVVISASGIFNPPKLPDIPGLERFAGPCFHTNRWPQDADLTGKHVAIIGNGASAMQTGPEIQDGVARLTVFQRSAHWAAPFEQFRRKVPSPIRFLLREQPHYRAWYRMRLGWTFNDRLHPALQKDPEWPHPERSLNAQNDAHRAYFTEYVRSELGARQDLLTDVLPTYPPFGKRMLLDNGWFRMLARDHVELVGDPITEVDRTSIRTAKGARYDVDAIVLATGFDVLRFLTTYEARGRSGRTLREVWNDDDARAYLGLAIPDFPNFFCLYGPNTQPGHGGSLIFVIEMQMHYIMDLLRKMTDVGAAAVECREDVHDAYNEGVDRAHERMVWTHPGMQTYYRNRAGRVVVNFPYRNVDLFQMTRSADLDDYRLLT